MVIWAQGVQTLTGSRKHILGRASRVSQQEAQHTRPHRRQWCCNNTTHGKNTLIKNSFFLHVSSRYKLCMKIHFTRLYSFHIHENKTSVYIIINRWCVLSSYPPLQEVKLFLAVHACWTLKQFKSIYVTLPSSHKYNLNTVYTSLTLELY